MFISVGFKDTNGYPVYVGDTLRSEDGYDVIVRKDSDGKFYGELVCEPTNSCANIPYALNKGVGYSKVILNPPPSDCPNCAGEREYNGMDQITCYFCGYTVENKKKSFSTMKETVND